MQGVIPARPFRGGVAMPRLRRKRAVSLGGVAGVWSDARLDDELRVRPLTDRSGWHVQVMAGHVEIARLAHLPGLDPASAWRCARISLPVIYFRNYSVSWTIRVFFLPANASR